MDRMKRLPRSVLFENAKIQIVERDIFDKVVLIEPDPGILFKVGNVGIKPYRFCDIELIAYAFDSVKHLMGTRVIVRVFNDGIEDHSVVFESSRPKSHAMIII